ncbi:MAG: type II toxin-antitoxin system prevent-host-death family antitoxin [Firmicutes bacterium]|nr:type II toxin-antitoxin system prevent-host-death family antitoxin [Bacillota bacterium]
MAAPIKVGIREAKAGLSKLLKEVRRGTEVIITVRGIPVGRIIPARRGDIPVEERLKELEGRGLIEPPRPASIGEEFLPLPIPGDLAQRMLQEDREG